MKEDEGLINYLTNIILRPHREIYSIQKLGPTKIVVKSHEKSISVLESMSRSQKRLPKQLQQKYCELIEVNRRQVTIRNQGNCIQASIYEPQLTTKQKKSTQPYYNNDKTAYKNGKIFVPLQKKQKPTLSYENCVIFLHPNSGSRIQGTQYAKHVLQYRTLCVSFDYTGSGISEGQYTTMGVKESQDLSAVIHYVAERYNVKKFSLWGRSMGAVTGIYYLLTKYKEDVKKIRVASCIIDSPFSDLQKLILEIASKRSNLPRFVFQPFMNVIEKDIISKIGINIFAQLNLVQKIKNLSPEDMKVLNSVSFLGLASKDDKMISHQHCEQLCQLLISKDVRNSQLIDDKYMIVKNLNDKYLMMLVEFKKNINTKGDFIQIQGDHNKPRTNQVKEKISFFIEDNFISYKDPFAKMILSETTIKQQPKPMTFTKTGLSIKTKLAFTKAVQNNGIKSRKDSQNYKDLPSQIPTKPNSSQIKVEQLIKGHNYNLINLKEIKAKQQQAKQSLSKQKQSIRNSLNKNFLFKDRKQSNKSPQTGNKGLNIVSKQFNKDRLKSNQFSLNLVKTPYDTMQSSKHYIQTKEHSKPSDSSTFMNFLNKVKQLQTTPKYKDLNTSIDHTSIFSQRISQHYDSVNNSLTKEDSTISGDNFNGEIIVSALDLSDNNISNCQPPNLTQRLPRPEKYFEGLPSQRYNRNAQSQTYVYQNKLQQSPGVSTTPFNLSIDNSSNLSFDMQNSFQQESFRKKQTSQILDATDLSFKKQGPKSPQVKISIQQFRNRHDDESNNKSANKKYPMVTKKQNTFAEANMSTHWSLDMNQAKGNESVNSEDKLSSKHSFQFKKRQPAQTNSIKNSDLSHVQSTEMGKNRSQNPQYPNQMRNPPNINHVQVHPSNKHPNVSNSFTQNSQMSMKQIMTNNGHKGLTQSSTFNGNGNQNNFYSQPQYPQYVYPQYQTHGQQYMVPCQQKPQSSNAYYSSNGQGNGFMGGMIQSMKTSQDHYNHINPQTNNYQNLNNMPNPQANIFSQNKPTSQSATYGTNPNTSMNTNTWYNANEPPKQPIDYKKKITRLLD